MFLLKMMNVQSKRHMLLVLVVVCFALFLSRYTPAFDLLHIRMMATVCFVRLSLIDACLFFFLLLIHLQLLPVAPTKNSLFCRCTHFKTWGKLTLMISFNRLWYKLMMRFANEPHFFLSFQFHSRFHIARALLEHRNRIAAVSRCYLRFGLFILCYASQMLPYQLHPCSFVLSCWLECCSSKVNSKRKSSLVSV